MRQALSRLRPAGVLAAVLVFTASLILGTAAQADVVKVRDNDRGSEAAFLAIRSVKFSNGRQAVTMKALHPSLQPRFVDRYAFQIYVDRSRETFNRRTFYLVRQVRRDSSFRKGLHLYRQSPGQETPTLLRCKGLRLRPTAARGRRPGRVAARVPQRCIGGSRFVKFNYTVENFGGGVSDTAPGGPGSLGDLTRWVRRG